MSNHDEGPVDPKPKHGDSDSSVPVHDHAGDRILDDRRARADAHAHEHDLEHGQRGRRGGVGVLPAVGVAAVAFAALELKARRGLAAGQPFATVRRSVTIAAEPDRVSEALGDPTTMGDLVAPLATVMDVSADRWTWQTSGPAGSSLTMRADITKNRPGELMAWSVGDGAAPHDVAIQVGSAGAGETLVRVEVALYPSTLLPLVGSRALIEKAADRTVATALYRLRAQLETGEMPTVDGQPSGLGEGGKDGSAAMATDDRGLGKVVYGGDAVSAYRDDERLRDGEDLVIEASEESFPASDPPVFSRGAATPPDVTSDTRQAQG